MGGEGRGGEDGGVGKEVTRGKKVWPFEAGRWQNGEFSELRVRMLLRNDSSILWMPVHMSLRPDLPVDHPNDYRQSSTRLLVQATSEENVICEK